MSSGTGFCRGGAGGRPRYHEIKMEFCTREAMVKMKADATCGPPPRGKGALVERNERNSDADAHAFIGEN
jgi:hypothetical protein